MSHLTPLQPANPPLFSMSPESLGIPRTKDPSRSLWEHICRKGNLPPPPFKSNPTFVPTGPLDQHATSMRVLLHDTQLNFEKFAVHTDKLLKEVGESKNEIKVLKALFERENETLTGEIMDLVNRCQTQIQKSLGTPAQEPTLSYLQKEVELRLSNFEERLESIKMHNQSHSQALQSQSQVLQTLQEQQNTILTSVLPLLPLIQSLPVHIENAQKTITEAVSKICVPASALVPTVITCPHGSDHTRSRTLGSYSLSAAGAGSGSKSKTLKRPFPPDIDESPSSPISLSLKKARSTNSQQDTTSLSHRTLSKSQITPQAPQENPKTPSPRHPFVARRSSSTFGPSSEKFPNVPLLTSNPRPSTSLTKAQQNYKPSSSSPLKLPSLTLSKHVSMRPEPSNIYPVPEQERKHPRDSLRTSATNKPSQELMPPPSHTHHRPPPSQQLRGPGQPGSSRALSIQPPSTTRLPATPASHIRTPAQYTPRTPINTSSVVTPSARVTRSLTARTLSVKRELTSIPRSVGKIGVGAEGRRFIIFDDSDDSATEEDD